MPDFIDFINPDDDDCAELDVPARRSAVEHAIALGFVPASEADETKVEALLA